MAAEKIPCHVFADQSRSPIISRFKEQLWAGCIVSRELSRGPAIYALLTDKVTPLRGGWGLVDDGMICFKIEIHDESYVFEFV